MSSKKTKANKSILHDYMRDTYEQFVDLLCRELEKKSPRGRSAELVKKTATELMDQHFGKDTGGTIFMD
jgi:hypothetical protein